MAVVERLALLVTADTTQAVRSLGQVEGSANKLGATTPRLSQVGQTLTRTLTPAALAAGAAFGQAFNKFDEGADALRAAGAQGDEFTESMKNVAANVPESFGEVGTVMGELYQRTRLTGPALEELTQQVVELGRLGQNASVDQLTRVFGDWGIEAEDATESIDMLYRVTQETGTGVDKLSDLIVRFGAPLREMGYGFEDAALLMGQFEASGVNTQLVMGGLRTALGEMASAGEDPVDTFARVVESIQNAGSAAEANSISMELFGRRAGIDMSRAIQEGRFNIDELAASLAANTDTVHEAASGMLDFSDMLKIWQNRLTALVGPQGETLMMMSSLAVAAGPVATGLSKVGTALKAMSVGSAALRMHDTAASIVAMGPAALTAAASVAALAYAWEQNQAKERQFAAGVEAVTAAIKDAGNEVDALSTLVNTSIETSPDMALGLEAIGATAADLETALSGTDAEFESFKARLEDGSEESQLLAMHLERMRNIFNDGVEAAGAMGTVLAVVADETDGAAGSTEEYVALVEEATDAFQQYQDTLRASIDPLFGFLDAQMGNADAQQTLNDLMAEGVYSGAEYDAALIALGQSALGVQTAANDLAFAIENGDVQLTEATDTLNGWVAAGLVTQTEADIMADKFRNAANEANGLAGDYRVNFSSSGIETVLQNLQWVQGIINQIAGQLPAAVSGLSGGSTGGSRSQTNNINVTGSGNPEQVAQRVSRAQRRFALERG